eukprot:UN00332
MLKLKTPKVAKKQQKAKATKKAKKVTKKHAVSQQERGVALADIKARVTSVRNIGKLTKALGMVATAQLRTARRQMEESRTFANPIMNSWKLPTNDISELAVKPNMAKGKEHLVAFATDRSLCGAVNAQLFKVIRPILADAAVQDRNDLVVTVFGEKGRAGLERQSSRFFGNVYTDITKCKEITFKQALTFTDAILKTNAPHGSFFYNYFASAMTFDQRRVPFTDLDTLVKNTQFTNRHTWNRNHETYKNYYEMQMAAMVFNFWAENLASEVAARMAAMSTSSKNAEDIAFLLNRFYNRTRQAKITSELIEINSGAQVIAEMDN